MSRAHGRFDAVLYAPWAGPLVGGSSFGGATGGGETQAVLLASLLAERGLRVGLIVVGAEGELPASVGKVRIVRQEPRRRSGGLLGRASLAAGAMRAMAGVRTDVLIQMNAGPTTGIAALVARLRGAHLVYMSMNVVDFEFARHEPSRANVRLYEWGVRHASEVVVQDSHQAGLCRARFGRDPVVIHSIATPAEPRTGQPEAFLWVGRLQSWKNPGAYLELARAVPEARFWMIAVPQASEPPEMRRRLDDALGELPNLELLDARPREELGKLMERAVAIVSTSESEGMPNVFLEAWSRGVPALALSFDPDGMIACNGLGAFAAGDPDRFAAQARRLWDQREDQAQLSERCVAYVRSAHGEERLTDRWLETIERVRRA
jgi:glycosyltransferase involved in cell wall biosynthesis